MYFVVFILLVSRVTNKSYFTLTSNLSQPESEVSCMKVSGDNKILAAGTYDNKVYIYSIDGLNIQYLQTLQGKNSQIYSVDMSFYHDWLIATDIKGYMFLYNFTDGLFVRVKNYYYQHQRVCVGDITEDHQNIIVGIGVRVYFYQFNETALKFNFRWKKNVISQISSISMTENNNLVVSYFTKKSQLFTIESSTISVSSTIVDSLNSPKRSQINNEGNYLVISSSSQNQTYLFQFVSNKFKKLNTFIHSTSATYSTFSQFSDYMFLSSSNCTQVYSYHNQEFVFLDTLQINSSQQITYSNSMTPDQKLVIIGGIGQIFIFTNNSQFPTPQQEDFTISFQKKEPTIRQLIIVLSIPIIFLIILLATIIRECLTKDKARLVKKTQEESESDKQCQDDQASKKIHIFVEDIS